MNVRCAVEGMTDEAVLRRLLREARLTPAVFYGKNGKSELKRKIDAYNQAAKLDPWLVLVDVDQDAECAPALRASWVPRPSPLLCFRVAVRQVESWLLADRERFADFFHVDLTKVREEHATEAKEVEAPVSARPGHVPT